MEKFKSNNWDDYINDGVAIELIDLWKWSD